MKARFVLALAVGLAFPAVRQADAQHLFEPEVGFKFYDGRINDRIGPGLSLGGDYGRIVSTSAAVTLHADVGFHGTRRSGDYGGNPGGGSFDLGLGATVSPALRRHDRRLAPYASATAGYGLAGIGGGETSWTLGVEGGLRLRAGEARDMALGVRVARHFWIGSDSGPASNEVVIAARRSFRLPV